MSELARTFPRAAFSGIEFPYVDVGVKGSLRHFVHEFFHAPGGEVENLERRLYEIEFTSDFQDVFLTYPGLWPENLHRLRSIFEKGTVAALTIPSIGIIQARCIEWDQRLVAKVLSGEKTRFKFLEEGREELLTSTSIAHSVAALQPIALQLQQELEAQDSSDLFTGIADFMNSLSAIGDQVDLYGDRIDSKLQGLTDACKRLDGTVKKLNEPDFHRVLDSLHELGVASWQLHRDLLKRASPIDLFEVPAPMTVTQIANFIYGETEKAADILKLNSFDDAFAIQPGTMVRFYVPEAA